MATPVTPIDAMPVPGPLRTMPQDPFDEAMAAWVAAFPVRIQQQNDQATATNQNATAAEEAAAAAVPAAATALAAAETAVNAPGTSATSVTNLTIQTSLPATVSLTIQPGKSLQVGMTLKIAATASPENWESGEIVSYNSGTGALVITARYAQGVGTFAAWTVSLAAPVMTTVSNAVRDTLTSAYTMELTDKGGVFPCAGTFTLSLRSAATLGNGWYCYVNKISGTITVDPSASELINGVATTGVGGFALLYCDGAAFKLHELVSLPSTVVLTATQSWSPSVSGWYEVTVTGGGGGCSTITSMPPNSCGGGGGGTAIKLLYLSSTITYTATVGAGAAAATTAPANGNTGGTSSFAGSGITTLFGTGGSGAGGTTTNGGVGQNGDINIPGGATTSGGSGAGSYTYQLGGASYFSGPTPYGTNGAGYGAGGGSSAVGATTGTTGYQGVIVIKKLG